MRILVAEDDLTSRNILVAVLKKWGYDPIPTRDGKEAWAVLQQPDAPKLVILDWIMPEMDGLEVCQRVRRSGTANPPYIILLTTKGEKRDIVQGLDAGGNDYICKPYDRDELGARIRVGQKMIALQTELVKTRDALVYEAMHDPLTGILNRRAILNTLKKELDRSKREGSRIGLGMCDIDHFKKINDTHGHQIGDEVLCQFVRHVQAQLRKYDHVGRWGGEEFLIVVPGIKNRAETNLFERLCKHIANKELPTRAGGIAITASIGVAGGTGATEPEALLAAADRAMYQAKHDGRNRVVYARIEYDGAIHSKSGTESALATFQRTL